tara:strand:- start:4474 stop:5205 length:732 start_codon:yes stop_codon:yes gene_type:complete
MAETVTRQFREPFVETAGLGVTTEGLRLLNQNIPTSTYTGNQFIQGQSALEGQAATAAAGLGALTGAQGYQQFQSPYQQQVIDASLAEFDRNAAVQQTGLRDSAIQMGAYGGGREGIMQAEAMRNNQLNRGQLQSGLLQEGFQNSQAQALAQLQAQQGLGTYQTQLGGQGRQLQQADLSAQQESAREAAFADYTRLGLVGPQLASVIGGFPAATQTQSTPPPSATQQIMGIGIGAAGLMGALR